MGRAVAEAVHAARSEERFRLVLAGNCLPASGAVAGEQADSIVWFDQHGDLNSPEISAYGFLDGMALAVTLGLCWKPMAAAIPGFRPIRQSRCILFDARDLDPDEKALLARLSVWHILIDRALEQTEKMIVSRAERLHVHLDLDVHDPALLAVNRYSAAGGPNPEEVRKALAELFQVAPVSGLTISAYDPAVDPTRKSPAAVLGLLTKCLSATPFAAGSHMRDNPPY